LRVDAGAVASPSRRTIDCWPGAPDLAPGAKRGRSASSTTCAGRHWPAR